MSQLFQPLNQDIYQELAFSPYSPEPSSTVSSPSGLTQGPGGALSSHLLPEKYLQQFQTLKLCIILFMFIGINWPMAQSLKCTDGIKSAGFCLLTRLKLQPIPGEGRNSRRKRECIGIRREKYILKKIPTSVHCNMLNT